MSNTKLLLIDNYDSFTYNLYHLFAQIEGVSITIKRNDENFLPSLNDGLYDGVIIGPGPGSPMDENYFGGCLKVILEYGTKGLPILGVCLGFQGIACAFGASLKRSNLPMHGKRSEMKIFKADTILAGLEDDLPVMRYHSLMIDPDKQFPPDLLVTAEVKETAPSVRTNGREIMAIEHRSHPIYGVQFHPESFATEAGSTMARNFLTLANVPRSLPLL
jgi:anthranilate synthase component 2